MTVCKNYQNVHCVSCTVQFDIDYTHSSGDNDPCHHCVYSEPGCKTCINGPYVCEDEVY